MPRFHHSGRLRKQFGFGLASVVLALGGLWIWDLVRFLGKEYWIFRGEVARMRGKSEREVVQTLGRPFHVIRRDEVKGRPLDYPWPGMSFRPVPDRPVTNKVLLYRTAWTAAYLFIDPKGRVEDVVVAGT